MNLYKICKIWENHSWYTEDIYELIEIHKDRFMMVFGTDCTWKNLRTKKIENGWDRNFRKLTTSEYREYQLNQLNIESPTK
jgi:hypothetical protein